MVRRICKWRRRRRCLRSFIYISDGPHFKEILLRSAATGCRPRRSPSHVAEPYRVARRVRGPHRVHQLRHDALRVRPAVERWTTRSRRRRDIRSLSAMSCSQITAYSDCSRIVNAQLLFHLSPSPRNSRTTSWLPVSGRSAFSIVTSMAGDTAVLFDVCHRSLLPPPLSSSSSCEAYMPRARSCVPAPKSVAHCRC